MLKKKRFSGLFGASVTEIPSPGPEQQAAAGSIGGANTNGFNSPLMLSNQGRQSSMPMLINNTSAATSDYFNNTSNTNGTGPGPVGTGMGDDDPAGNVLTRGEVHSSLENLKKLVIAAESYRELTAKLAKTTKQLGKCFKEYGDTKGMDSTYVMCLKSSANFYESFAEMESKLATCLQKDFELLQGNWEKHTKRVTKDERAHDEILGDLDERIKKISMSYDRKNKRPDPNTALMSHEKYISTLSELQESIASAKRDHRNTVARRERYTHSLTAQIACRLSEAQFLAIERQLRGSGPSLLKIKEWAPYAGQDMPPPTLVTDGEPTIEVRSGSFEEYIARHTPSGGGSANNAAPNGSASNKTYNSMPGGYQSQKMDPGMASPTGSPAPITLTEMPQITLPPFAPMQQHLQQQQQQQQGGSGASSSQQPYFQSPTPTELPQTMPVPSVVTPAGPSTKLPTTMPEPKNYIPQQQQQQRQSIIDQTPPQMITPQPTRVDKILTTTTTTGGGGGGGGGVTILKPVSSTDHKVLVKEPVGIISQPPVTKIIPVEKPVVISMDSTVVVAEPVPVLTTSPPTTPGAFPSSSISNGITATILTKEPEPILKPVVVTPATVTKIQGSAGGMVVNTSLEGSWPEDQGSISTKVGGSSSTDDGGSTTRSRDQAALMAKMDYFRERESRALLTQAADEVADAAALDRYHRENYMGRYRYADEESIGGPGGGAGVGSGAYHHQFREGPGSIVGEMGPDDLYDEPYSPISGGGDHHPYYDDGGDDITRTEPRRFYDDDESQHSGSIPIQRIGDRDREYYTARSRYEERERERDYDRPYQHYSSSMTAVTRRQQPYPGDRDRERERDQDRAEWAAAASAMIASADEVSSLSGYAREQYPSSGEYPTARPTLEDRERELDMLNQKAAAAAVANATGGGRTTRVGSGPGPDSGISNGGGGGYGGTRRPASTAPGTVAHLRRRFSDLSVSDMAAAAAAGAGSHPSGMTSPTQQGGGGGGPRPRGMSGSSGQQQAALIQDTVRSRDRDARYPPRASTPQNRAAIAAAGYQYERGMSKQGFMTGGSSSQLVGGGGGTNGRYSKAGGGGGHFSDYEDGSTRMSRLVSDQRERRR